MQILQQIFFLFYFSAWSTINDHDSPPYELFAIFIANESFSVSIKGQLLPDKWHFEKKKLQFVKTYLYFWNEKKRYSDVIDGSLFFRLLCLRLSTTLLISHVSLSCFICIHDFSCDVNFNNFHSFACVHSQVVFFVKFD